MKRVQAACILRTLVFQQKEDAYFCQGYQGENICIKSGRNGESNSIKIHLTLTKKAY